jgi:hypothetical protein
MCQHVSLFINSDLILFALMISALTEGLLLASFYSTSVLVNFLSEMNISLLFITAMSKGVKLI